MRLTPFGIAPLAAVLIAAAPAKSPPLAPLYRAPQAQADRVHATVQFLADDLLEGRGTGKRGHEVAAAYVASRFRALGLQPAGENGSWYQRVPFRRATIDGTPSFTLTLNGKSEALTDKEMAVRPSVTEQVRNLSAPLVYVGFGLRDPKLKLDDYAGLDVRGKIVITLGGTPPGLPSDIAAHLSSRKAEMAAAAGAIGILDITNGNAGTRPVTDWIDKEGRAGSTPQGLRVRGIIARSLAERLFAASPQPLAAVMAARAAGKPLPGFALGSSVAMQVKSAWSDFTSPEVVGKMEGSDPRLKAEHVVLMGHLDHLGIKEDAKPGEDNIYNGALDNAAGVATMLEAAERFVASGQKPKRSLLFIANTGEELGLLGASYWAAHPTVPVESVTAGIDLDMPLPLYDFTDVTAFGAEHSTIADAVAKAGRTMGVSVGPDPMPEQGIFVRSDHYPLVLRGIPAILMFTGHANGGKPKWDAFFAGAYHRLNDDLNQDINWGALARYGELNYRIARELADSPQRATWKKGDYFARP
ncbi:M20/M25/M40 family metallo-hydrolase [Sphingomonas astaxanthinifaciens]|uniref:Aminopeptidase n=1 Tax=Sphingomonas astaxanthinifaciens DSM 22298 TaxID=1123267 RepID=A0ABQ5ZAW1_9SPHN|nr:M20/M25/M40 family metallo-hydrolase [Sphingomonas astaxanthinifaciens]GLR48740.1 aminopeptidase [Sphingomonas astaxanthinifaciens DSM 22298]